MSQLKLSGDASGTGIVTVAAPNTNSTYTVTLPAAAGTLVTGAAGSDTQVQFNDSGSFGGDAGLTYNKTTNTLSTDVYVASAGTASAPSVTTTGDTNTGVFFPAADTAAITTGGSERMRINSSGNVGIGTSAPLARLTVSDSTTTNGTMTLGNNSSYNGTLQYIFSTGELRISQVGGASLGTTFYTDGTERMRITSSGNVGIGVTPSTGSGFSQRLQIKQADGIYSGLQIQKSDDDSILGVGYWTTPAAFSFVATYTSTGSYLPISFYTNNAENLRINTNGTIKTSSTISVGNATPSTSGAGITFPASQSASSDANTLDDYEEGTFTPTTSNISFAFAIGIYTKIGRVVQIGIALIWPTTSDGNQVVISGLPFTCANNEASRGGVSVAYSEYTTVVTTLVNKNTTNLYLYKWSGNQPTNAELSAKTLYLGGTYLV